MRKQVITLWKRSSKNGKTYLSGIVDLGLAGSVNVVIFQNDKKKSGNQPDYYGMLSEPRIKEDSEKDPCEEAFEAA